MNLYNSQYIRCPHLSPSLLQGHKGQTIAHRVRMENEWTLLMSQDRVCLMFLSKTGWTWWSDSVGTNPHTTSFQTCSLVQFWTYFWDRILHLKSSCLNLSSNWDYSVFNEKRKQETNQRFDYSGSADHFRQSQSSGLAHGWHFPASQPGLASWEMGA